MHDYNDFAATTFGRFFLGKARYVPNAECANVLEMQRRRSACERCHFHDFSFSIHFSCCLVDVDHQHCIS